MKLQHVGLPQSPPVLLGPPIRYFCRKILLTMVINPLQITHRLNPMGTCLQNTTEEKKVFQWTSGMQVPHEALSAPLLCLLILVLRGLNVDHSLLYLSSPLAVAESSAAQPSSNSSLKSQSPRLSQSNEIQQQKVNPLLVTGEPANKTRTTKSCLWPTKFT